MTKLLASTLVLTSAAAYAQTQLPDCRSISGPVGTTCVFTGTQLPVQKYLGDISLPSSDHVHMTGPLVNLTSPPPPHHFAIDLGFLGGVQAETFGGFWDNVHRSAGLKEYALFQLKPWLDVDVRGVTIPFASTNHSESIQAGPRFVQAVGPIRVYAEALAGVGHQYYWGLPVSGAVGVSIPVKKTRFSIIPFDGTYGWYTLQSSTRSTNPRRGRIEGFAGLQYHFGKQT